MSDLNIEVFSLGALESPYDIRDYKVEPAGASDEPFPALFELLKMPRVKSQGSVSSCVAHAMSTILEWHYNQEYARYESASTDFIYGMQFVLNGRMSSGMYLRDACQISQKWGDLYASTCPGNTEMPECLDKIEKVVESHETNAVTKELEMFKTKMYARCESDNEIKKALMSHGPVLASLRWYKDTKCVNGVLVSDQKEHTGNHCVVIYGWNEKGFLCQNSWGTSWGNRGRFILSPDYKVREAWSLIDHETEDIVKPKRGKFLDVIWSIINALVNAVRDLFKED